MEKRIFLLLKTLLLLVAITESAVILPKKPSQVTSVPPVIGEDKKLEPNPEFRNQRRGSYDASGVEYDHSGQPSGYDYNQPGANNGNEDGIKPEIYPGYEEENRDKEDGPPKPGDEENFEPFDGEAVDEDEESKPSIHEYDELNPSTDETDKKVPEVKIDDGGIVPEEENDDGGIVPEEKIDDGGIVPEEGENKDKGVDEEGDEHEDKDKIPEEDNRNDKESGHFFGDSIFNTPFFNLNRVRKYFNQMERALGQVFHQVLDEARLLNGTYANTTEEEVNIGGRKYVVQKSVIKGADKHSSIYVETLSTKPKLGRTKVIKGVDMKNDTKE